MGLISGAIIFLVRTLMNSKSFKKTLFLEDWGVSPEQ